MPKVSQRASCLGLEPLRYTVSDEEVIRRMREADEDPEVMITFDQLVSGLRLRAN